MGMSRAGFKHTYMAEFDYDAVETVLHNKKNGIEHVRDWPMGLQDVREIDWKTIETLDVISGGRPVSRLELAEKNAARMMIEICGLKPSALFVRRGLACSCSRTSETWLGPDSSHT